MLRTVLCCSLFVFLTYPACGGDWARFRGPNGSGVDKDATQVPTTWSPEENIRWKAALPGPGVSSPIVIGDRVFVTCYSGYGVERNDGSKIEDLKRHLVCVDRTSGDLIWDKTIAATLPEDPYEGIGVTAHGYASHTPVSDGEHVFAFLGKSGVVAFDFDGNQLWQTAVGTESDPWAWGSASSPILWGDTVIVTASAESQAVVALNKANGEEVWRQEASRLDGMWGTPILVEADDRTDLVLAVAGEIWGMNPDTGKLRWYCSTSQANQAQTSAVVNEEGVVFSISGRDGSSAAVKVGGKGDVSESNKVWTGRDTSRFGSPVYADGKLYLIASGVIRTIDASSGERLSEARLSGGTGGRSPGGSGGPGGPGGGRGGRGGGRGFGGSLDYASPIIAGEHLYYIKGNGETFVFKLGDKPEQVAVNRLTEDEETFGGSPAITGDSLIFRSSRHLYCVGQ